MARPEERFDFMWEIIAQGASGVVLLIDNSRNYPQRDLKNYVSAFEKQIAATRFIVGVTRTDIKTDPPLEAYAQWLGELGINAEVACIDPREREDVLFLLNRLLAAKKGHTQEPLSERPEDAAADAWDDEDGEETSITYESMDELQFDETVLAAASNLRGVTGVSLTNEVGELIQSSIADEDLNGFIAYLSGLAPTYQERIGMGKIRRLTLKSPKDESPTVFMGSGHGLGLSSERSLSVPLLGEQVEELMQWIGR